MTPLLLSVLAAASVQIQAQHIRARLDPAAHEARVTARLDLGGEGTARLELAGRAEIDALRLDDEEVGFRRDPAGGDGRDVIEVDVPAGATVLTLSYTAHFEQDVEAGEQPGEIHNFSVDAHLGEDGLFLSDGSAWHPRPVDETGRPILHLMRLDVEPRDGWTLVASGDPAGDGDPTDPVWSWSTPRPVDGLALAGNQHVIVARRHDTEGGPVDIVMHVPEEHREQAELFIGAAAEYMDLYVPRLGPFPYRRFTIAENFFSSGFAYPGFTLLGPQVVGMGGRALAPGYLDHELVHNWWGNGVYVDPDDGNWCEALTSYCANYWRRIADDGPAAGRAYRRGVLMRLSTDPDGLDDGPLGAFGSARSSGGPGRFVGYDKGAFVFAMIEDLLVEGGDEGAMWSALRRFAEDHLGGRAGWRELQVALEAQHPQRGAGWLDGFFDYWVRGSGRPQTPTSDAGDAARAFAVQVPAETGQRIMIAEGAGDRWCEIDPDFRIYRVLPPRQIIPTIAGTLGRGGCAVETNGGRAEIDAFVETLEATDGGENLLLIGAEAARAQADLLARVADPILVGSGSFTIAGRTWDGSAQSVLHTMQHPDRPGRFVTVFVSNGEEGWSRLRLIRFYSRDTTIVWEGNRVVERRVFEPDRRVYREPEQTAKESEVR